MIRYLFDIETDGLMPDVSVMHCAVITDVDTKEEIRFGPDKHNQFLAKLDQADVIIGHNIIGYDIPVLFYLFGWKMREDVTATDTLVMSRFYNANGRMHSKCPAKVWDEHNQKEKNVGPHTLMNLGYFAGVYKGDFGEEADWKVYSQAMMDYCADDVRCNIAVFYMLERALRFHSFVSIQNEMNCARIIAKQMANGWVYDLKRGRELEAEMAERILLIEKEVLKTFKPLPTLRKVVQPRVKMSDMSLSVVGLKFFPESDGPIGDLMPLPEWRRCPDTNDVIYLSGSFSRIDYKPFALSSRKQIAQQLLYLGWKPYRHTDKGNIIVDDVTFQEVKDDFPEAELLADYFLISKKLSMVKSWNEKCNEETGRIHGYVNTLGAATTRMSHSGPNLAQVPSVTCDSDGHLIYGFDGAFGADCRALFTVAKGRKLVGVDASGLELRVLAHYMNDPVYIATILNGDIHTYNQKAAGLSTRDSAKTFIYSFLYGAGAELLGKNGGGDEKLGRKLKKQLLKSIPALAGLIKAVGKACDENGKLKSIDGRYIPCKESYKSLNFLLQSAGSTVVKVAMQICFDECDKRGLDVELNGTIHDEWQTSVADKDVEEYAELCVWSIQEAGRVLGTRIPMDGEAKIGNNWAETH